MTTILLLNPTVNSQVQPVSGRSGKLYGNATYNPSYNCVTFVISHEDYERDKLDLIGNTAPGQQWVPSFGLELEDPLEREPINNLRHMAKEARLDATGSKSDLVARLRAAQKGSP